LAYPLPRIPSNTWRGLRDCRQIAGLENRAVYDGRRRYRELGNRSRKRVDYKSGIPGAGPTQRASGLAKEQHRVGSADDDYGLNYWPASSRGNLFLVDEWGRRTPPGRLYGRFASPGEKGQRSFCRGLFPIEMKRALGRQPAHRGSRTSCCSVRGKITPARYISIKASSTHDSRRR